MNPLQRLLDWIRGIFGVDTTEELPIIEEYHREDRLLRLIFNKDNAPLGGLVSTWLCHSESSMRDLLMVCANLSAIRESLSKPSDRLEDPEQRFWQRSIEVTAKRAIKDQGRTINGTHLVIIASINKNPILTSRGKFRHLECQEVAVVDFQGHLSGLIRGDVVASKVMRAVAESAFKIDNGPYNTWEEIIFGEPKQWVDWLEVFTRRCLNSPTHVLRPPKAPKAKGR